MYDLKKILANITLQFVSPSDLKSLNTQFAHRVTKAVIKPDTQYSILIVSN
jgi:hypothetical protein